MDYRIISIGALGRHELWGESTPGRTAHATTTLVRSGDRVILVDPGLPGQIIAARLTERAGITPDQVTDVFLTCFRPAHRMGLSAFPDARWLISEAERETVGRSLIEYFEQEQDTQAKRILEQDIALLKKCQAASDRIAENVDLFPLPGFTPGVCGLLLSLVNTTVLIAGDAVATVEHMEQGRVLRACGDAEQAGQSFLEALEIADVLVPGHDNVQINRTRGGF